jgi:hypothetical protein
MVDEQIGHDVGVLRQGSHVVPRSKPRVDVGVVEWVEARVGSVNRMEERKQVNAAEESLERTRKHLLKIAHPRDPRVTQTACHPKRSEAAAQNSFVSAGRPK